MFHVQPFRPLRQVASALAVLLAWRAAAAEPRLLDRRQLAAWVEQAPALTVARSERRAAESRAAAASVLSLENPQLSALGGLRFNPDGRRTFSGVGSLSWPVEVGEQRGTRTSAARAELREVGFEAEESRRKLLLDALLQHASVLRDERYLELAAERGKLSERLLRAAERRRTAGSVPELDVTLAAMQARRDVSAKESAQGERDGDQLQLQALLGVDGEVRVVGALVPAEEPPLGLPAAQGAEQQPLIARATAMLAAATARAARERAARLPALNVLAQYERDDGANIGMLGLSWPLPVLNANRAQVAGSAADVATAKAHLALVTGSVRGELLALHARYRATGAALAALAPVAELSLRAVNLATRTYELGESDLASVLLVRREAVEAQAALLEAEFAHATIKLELLVSAGRVPR